MQTRRSSFRPLYSLLLTLFFVPVLARASEAPAENKVEAQPEGFPKSFTFKSKKLYDDIAYLASEECAGREAGSPGEAKAREFLIKRLRDMGYDEVRRLPFEFVADMKLGSGNVMKASFAAGTSKEYGLDKDFRPMRFSRPASIDASKVVFAGYGISAPDKGYDDYKDLDVKGKIVLVLRHEPETPDGKHIGNAPANPHHGFSMYSDFFYKAATARDKGAAALIFVNGARSMKPEARGALEDFKHVGGHSDCGIPFVQVLPDVADQWLQAGGKDSASLQKAIDAELKPQSFELPGVSLNLHVDVVKVRGTDENLAVVLPGTDPKLKDEFIVIGAHYDHLGHGNEFSLADKSEMGKLHGGADDNASGDASVLQLAEALHKNRLALKRTVWLMLFGGEELGTLGSANFVASPPPEFSITRAAAMLNLDMVGRCKDKKLMVYGAATGTGFDKVIESANSKLGLSIKTTADGFGGSDQTCFVSAGVPVLFFFTGSHSDYHKPSDTVDKINAADQATITAFVYNCAAELINAPERPKYVKVEAPKMSSSGFGVVLSLMPDYAYEGKGLRVGGVRDKGPADKAGIKAGDTVVKLGGKNVENIEDYMNALRQLTAGTETDVSVLREGKQVDLKVTPEKR
ncbi:MAG TPA: M20/M25/M40 family metallo-hydrolase [Planctomycetota bacterium]|jgi:hypothetical protein